MIFEIVLALSPIILILLLLFILRKPLYFISPVVLLFTSVLVIFVWKMSYTYLLASVSKGFLVALDIILIIFGAIFFLEFLKKTKLLDSIKNFVNSISPDKRVLTVLLVWFFGSFIEGTAGFGTPAAIVAPLLVGLGFNAVVAVAVALIGNTTAVTFGAVGTPIRIGFAGLGVENVAVYTGLINLIAGIFVPLMLVSVVVMSERNWKMKNIYEITPFALFAGLCFVIPYFLLTFVGQEFPSLLGPLIGLSIITFTTKKGFLIPKNVMRVKKAETKNSKGIYTAMFPYAALIGFLVLGKFTLPSFGIEIFKSVPHSFNLFNPGFAFLFAIALTSLIYGIKTELIKSSAKESFSKLLLPFLTIFFLVSIVQVMIYSGNNASGMKSMLELVAVLIQTSALPFISPLIGSFGAFIAGSATVSNILFGSFQNAAALSLNLNPSLILALQLVGAGIGNMIALTNIIAAQATVKLHDKEVDIIKIVVVPFIIYSVLAGIIGLILSGIL